MALARHSHSKAEEERDLEQRVARIRKLTGRQRRLWDRTLDCRSYRRISSLPSSFFSITGLHTLLIPRNELSCIPPAIRHLSTLAFIDVSNNSLTELPHELGELPLQFLNVSYNKLKWMPASIIERHPDIKLEVMCNPWPQFGGPLVAKANTPFLPTLFQLCCSALSANESLFTRVTTAPNYAAMVPLQIKDYLTGDSADTGHPPHDDEPQESDQGRKACSHCGKVFYGKAFIERTYSRTIRTTSYGDSVHFVGYYCSTACGRVRIINGKVIPY